MSTQRTATGPTAPLPARPHKATTTVAVANPSVPAAPVLGIGLSPRMQWVLIAMLGATLFLSGALVVMLVMRT